MRRTSTCVLAVGIAGLVGGCMPAPTAEQTKTISDGRQALAKQDRANWIMVGAEGFKKPVTVERVSKTRAIVIPVAGKLRYVDIEDAARQATGCAAKATPAIYAAANNNPTRLLTNAQMRSFNYRLPADLSC